LGTIPIKYLVNIIFFSFFLDFFLDTVRLVIGGFVVF
jgi:hypothetical protein